VNQFAFGHHDVWHGDFSYPELRLSIAREVVPPRTERPALFLTKYNNPQKPRTELTIGLLPTSIFHRILKYRPPHRGYPEAVNTKFPLASTTAMIADPTRAAMLSARLDAGPLSAGELARCANVSAQSASMHLAQLLAGGFLKVSQEARNAMKKMDPLGGVAWRSTVDYYAEICEYRRAYRRRL
jgi:DNA-binding transcriptional ArsR family regulator